MLSGQRATRKRAEACLAVAAVSDRRERDIFGK